MEICTGSYTGEYSPKVNGPWARYFQADGTFIEKRETEPMPLLPSPMDRIATALEFFRARAESGADVMKALP